MLSQEDKSERLVAAGVLAVVVSPCLIPCVYHLALGHYQAALLYAVPAVCCGLLYLGFLRMFGLGSAIETGIFVFLVCITCAVLTPVVIKLHSQRHAAHHASGTVTGEKYHAARVAVTDLPGV